MAEKKITLTLEDGQMVEKPLEYRLEDLAKERSKAGQALVVAAKVNNKLRELTYHLEDSLSGWI